MRVTTATLFAALLLGLFAAASAQESDWTCPEGFEGQTLSVYNWTTYIAEDTISGFETACGVTVQYDTYPTDDDMLARIRQGNPGYDIVVPSDVVVHLMIDEDLLLEIDKSLLPNWSNLDEDFTDLAFDPANTYTVPYQWGTTGIGYNVNAVGFEVTSWQDMFEYDGPVSWLADVPGMFGIALLMQGHDPNSRDEAQLSDANDFLIDNGRNDAHLNHADGQQDPRRG